MIFETLQFHKVMQQHL